MSVIKRFAPSRLPAVLAAGSFLSIIVLLTTTNPADKIGFAMLFFLLLLVFLISSGYGILHRIRGGVTPKSRYRLLILSLFLVIILMFRSSQSLGWLEMLVLIAVMLGLAFYSARRA